MRGKITVAICSVYLFRKSATSRRNSTCLLAHRLFCLCKRPSHSRVWTWLFLQILLMMSLLYSLMIFRILSNWSSCLTVPGDFFLVSDLPVAFLVLSDHLITSCHGFYYFHAQFSSSFSFCTAHTLKICHNLFTKRGWIIKMLEKCLSLFFFYLKNTTRIMYVLIVS